MILDFKKEQNLKKWNDHVIYEWYIKKGDVYKLDKSVMYVILRPFQNEFSILKCEIPVINKYTI